MRPTPPPHTPQPTASHQRQPRGSVPPVANPTGPSSHCCSPSLAPRARALGRQLPLPTAHRQPQPPAHPTQAQPVCGVGRGALQLVLRL